MTDSWRLKLHRAEEHLADLKALLKPTTERRPHPISEAVESKDGVDRYTYRLAMDSVPDERAPIIVGEFLFNVRSALDHLASCLVAPQNKGKVQFPIFFDDPFALVGSGPAHVHAQAWIAWKGRTKLIPPLPLAAIQRLQPFETARQYGENPDDQPLAILDALHNADKHSQLVLTLSGVEKVELIRGGDVEYWVPLFPDGTQLATAPDEMDVKITGAARVITGISYGAMRPFPETFDTLLDYIAVEALPSLERLFPRTI